MLYQAYQAQRDLTGPVVALAGISRRVLGGLPDGLARYPVVRQMAAGTELLERARLTHDRPAYGIRTAAVGGMAREVVEETALQTPFGTLLRFCVRDAPPQPQVLLVTAMAGHFSTLLRGTVQALVADHEVYVTDWHNARDVPLENGQFGLDDYISQVIAFLEHIGPGAHVVAVCQPCPATLSAVAVMAAGNHPAQPRSMTLMAGPVDTRVNPTGVNDLAHSKPLTWFETNVIETVPWRYRGAGRRVYPGFLQLSAFVSMNLPRHVAQHLRLYNHLLRHEDSRVTQLEDFYDEYFAVMDMPAEFYLQTIDAVFQRQLLPKGELRWQGQPVEPAAIRRTALLTVEGEKDDICGLGQTLAAHDLCSGLNPIKKRHHLQAGAGHYGVFSGGRWEKQIYPVVRNFILANN